MCQDDIKPTDVSLEISEGIVENIIKKQKMSYLPFQIYLNMTYTKPLNQHLN